MGGGLRPLSLNLGGLMSVPTNLVAAEVAPCDRLLELSSWSLHCHAVRKLKWWTWGGHVCALSPAEPSPSVTLAQAPDMSEDTS